MKSKGKILAQTYNHFSTLTGDLAEHCTTISEVNKLGDRLSKIEEELVDVIMEYTHGKEPMNESS